MPASYVPFKFKEHTDEALFTADVASEDEFVHSAANA